MESLSIDTIFRHLSDPKIAVDVVRCRHYLSRVLQLSTTKSADLSVFFPPVVNLMAHSDLLIKKTAFSILTKISGFKSELLILAVNTLLKDVRDSNPTVRALALQTICSVNHDAFTEHRVKCIMDALQDNSSYVRRTAVMSAVSVDRSDLGSLKGTGIVNRLYELIRDPDPIVLVNCLLALEEILKLEGGVVFNKKIVSFILNRLDSLTTWGLVYVTRILLKYQPKSDEEALDLMNVLDPLLDKNSATLSIHTLELFLHLIKNMPHLKHQVFQRCENAFLVIFTSGNSELISAVIEYLQPYASNVQAMFATHYKTLFCRLKDPVSLKIHKLNLVTGIVNADNFSEILDEIILNCSSKDVDVSLCAIHCLEKLVKGWPDLAENLLRAFVKLLKSEKDHVVSNTMQVLVSLPLDIMRMTPAISEQLCVIAMKVTDSEGILAALYLIGQLDNNTPDVLYVVENFMENFGDLGSKVKGQLLLTGVQLLCRRPAEFQPVIGELMDMCLQDDDRDLIEQAKFYYTILHDDTEGAIEIFSKT